MDSYETPVKILAIDDDATVLDSYSVLFGNSKNKDAHSDELDQLMGLTGMDAGGTAQVKASMQFDLHLVNSGEAGFEQVCNDQFGVILLDMRMPGGWDGMETARKIREVDQQVRIILITAYMDHTLEALRSEIGVNFAYLQKPFDRNELVQLTLLLSSDWQREQRLIKAEKVMAEAAKEADRANKAKDDFLASMSHELRTPLTSLLGNCELMSGSQLDRAQLSLLTSMEVSGKSLLYLINDILDSSKIEAGLFEIDKVEFNPLFLVDELQQIFSNRAMESGISFEIEVEQPFEHMLIGDGRRLSQVLINLLSNAVKFTQKGVVKLSIVTDRTAGKLQLQVEDSGIGMDQETLGRIFKPFEQANRDISGRFGGTGLGLHISWNLTQLMGGEILVSSEADKGSCFEVVLPLREGSKLEQLVADERSNLPPLPLHGRILIAEDTPELQLLERRMIESQTTEVVVEVVNHGQQALERIAQQHYDLVLMDMQMPVMDGITATQKLRAEGYQQPIVALTANVMQKQRDQFFAAGCDDFLSKPIDRVNLRKVLKKYMLQQPAERAEIAMPVDEPVAEPPKVIPAVVDPMIDDELMALFRERSAVLRNELMVAYESGNWEEVGHAAHTIKGSGSSFGFPQLTELGKQVQNAVLAGEFDRAAVAVAALDLALSEV